MSGSAGRKWLSKVQLLVLTLVALLFADPSLVYSRGAFSYAPPNSAVESDDSSVTARSLWPESAPTRLSEIGRGKGVIYSPDLSVPTNRSLYERLGFSYFEDASWATI